MRILHLVGTLNPGGLERVAVDLSIEQQRMGHEPGICCLFRREGILIEMLEQQGIPVLEGCGGMPWMLEKALASRLTEFRPHIVHSHVNYSLLWQVRAVRKAGSLPLIVTQHSLLSASWLGRLRSRILYRLARPGIALHTAVSKYAANYASQLYGIPVETFRVIYNGIRISHYRFDPEARATLRNKWGFSAKSFVWGSVGRLDPVKGHDVLLEAFAQAAKRVPLLRLVIVGKGSMEPALIERAQHLGCSDRVLWLGQRNDVSAVLSACDGYVQPSRSESLSVAVLEALANGLPVVAFKVGGIPEIASQVPGAISLLPPEDSEALAAALGDVERRLKPTSARCSLLPVAFSLQSMVKSYEQCYQEVQRDCEEP